MNDERIYEYIGSVYFITICHWGIINIASAYFTLEINIVLYQQSPYFQDVYAVVSSINHYALITIASREFILH